MNVGNIVGVLMPTRALNLQVFSLSLCRTHLFALLSRLLILSYVSCHQQTLIKQQILYRKTAHSLSKVVYAKALKQQKLKCLLIISIKHMR